MLRRELQTEGATNGRTNNACDAWRVCLRSNDEHVERTRLTKRPSQSFPGQWLGLTQAKRGSQMAQATHSLLDLESALQLVKAAGYRVTP